MEEILTIRQRSVFYIADMTVDDKYNNITHGAANFPQKCRPWIVVSNNKQNLKSETITMIPIYTRNTVTSPLQVYFKNGEREQVTDCAMVTPIPRNMIKSGSYVGTVSNRLWSKINRALGLLFSTTDFDDELNEVAETNTEENPMDSFTEMIIEASNRADVRNIIIDKIADAFVLGLNDNFMNTPHNVSHNEVIKNDADVDDDIMYEPVIISMDKFINKNNSPNISNEHDEEDDTSIHTSHTTHKIKNPTGRGRKHMSDDMCIAFFADAEKLTIDELNAKYEGYCYCRNKTELLKKINKQRTRLVKKGVINA